jgi:hypothetical protein
MSVPPRKTHSVRVVDPYGVLPSAIARQLVQLVPRGHFQIVQFARGMNHVQFPPRNILNSLPLPDTLVVKQLFGGFALKRLNHKYSI